MRYAPLALALAAVLAFSANAQANQDTTLPMHAIETTFGPCEIPDVCLSPDGPTTNVPPGSSVFIYLLVRNYTNVAGVQTAFDFGGQTFAFGLWDCQPNQLFAVTPGGTGGPTDGTISTAFDCIQGGETAVVGRMNFIMTAAGQCVTQVESTFPDATHLVDCTGGNPTPIDPANRGSVCAGLDGVNACQGVVPVEASTWGAIKGQYR